MSNSRSSDIVESLKTEILSGRFLEGERLPSERDLAARFGSSRGAVREALSQLELLGIIHILPGGARVQPVDSANISILGSLLAQGEMPDSGLVDQFLQVFGALAVLAARESILKASEEQLNQMQELAVSVSQCGEDLASMLTRWIALLEYQSEVAANLVARLIGNDLKGQFVQEMAAIDISHRLDNTELKKLVETLTEQIEQAQAESAAVVIQQFFDLLRVAMQGELDTSQSPGPRMAGVAGGA